MFTIVKEKPWTFAIAAIAVVVILIVGVAVAGYFYINQKTVSSMQADYERKRIEEELKKAQERSAAIDAELFELRTQMEELKDGIAESARVRDEVHSALDNAVTIDDVNELLRKSRRKRQR